jgi:hypothetical protein
MGSISFGMAFVAGKNRVPYPAAGNRHFLITGIAQSFRNRYFFEFKKQSVFPQLVNQHRACTS